MIVLGEILNRNQLPTSARNKIESNKHWNIKKILYNKKKKNSGNQITPKPSFDKIKTKFTYYRAWNWCKKDDQLLTQNMWVGIM